MFNRTAVIKYNASSPKSIREIKNTNARDERITKGGQSVRYNAAFCPEKNDETYKAQ